MALNAIRRKQDAEAQKQFWTDALFDARSLSQDATLLLLVTSANVF